MSVKRTAAYFALFLAVITATSGCDLIRAAFHKPTSKDLEVLRQEKLAKEQAVKDSAAAAAALARAAADSAKVAPDTVSTKEKRYCVIAGSFSFEENASSYVKELRDKGYDAYYFRYRSHRYNVALYATDDRNQAYRDCESFASSGDCEGTPWVYESKSRKVQ